MRLYEYDFGYMVYIVRPVDVFQCRNYLNRSRWISFKYLFSYHFVIVIWCGHINIFVAEDKVMFTFFNHTAWWSWG